MAEITYTFLPTAPGAPRMGGNIVYFMYSGGRVKIGYSGGVDGRHKQLRTAGAFPPVVLLVMSGDKGAESDLHIRFAADRLHGEWFALSKELRSYLRGRLCDVGRASLDRAEAEFRDYCQSFLEGYKPPAKHKPRPHCEHGMPLGATCPPCERVRDLAILEQINNGTYRTA